MNLPSIFNCSNDMALAANVRQYLPPRRIQQMEADLADLSAVWADTRFAGPWGWSLATKQRYKQMGVPVEALPSDEWIDGVRRLSSREFACRYVQEMLSELKDPMLLGGEMQWYDRRVLSRGAYSTSEPTSSTSIDRPRRHRSTDVDDIDWTVLEASHAMIFKSPWSSSGRGVFVDRMADGKCQASTLKRLQGFLSSQDGFVADHFYEDKVLDFAMEFFVHEGHEVEFLGYSVFETGEHGAYGYNYVESQEELLHRIGVDASLLNRLIDYHKEHLSVIDYKGPLGIDMLKTADGSVHPCLEMNFRMNMGILALLLHEQYGSDACVNLTPLYATGFQAKLEKGKFFLQMVGGISQKA